ncbi:hypothetical protein RIF29_20184 [Crotalaria pallida]|uniref:Uncharacterized protein n=1 Tax=Crotalaria pallida TaxID=3830 RepID=A0AAN9F0S5_CROPI
MFSSNFKDLGTFSTILLSRSPSPSYHRFIHDNKGHWLTEQGQIDKQFVSFFSSLLKEDQIDQNFLVNNYDSDDMKLDSI